ncbi:ATP-binding cassette domain-containing protein [Corynebacterium pseudotuberculosis]|uniref:ATP-binding cassette domain-containing protein n=1 Tax=Corynebacterium pseudotuberculosis TaxID=1719 RepID=UPI000655D7EC|nr:ATP-binding cassette domain-containing protein [Corynebacterium pseudotuberculosis]
MRMKNISDPRPVMPKMPPAVVFLAALGISIIIFPLGALWYRINVTSIPEVWQQPATRELLTVTVGSALWATIICVLLGVPIALLTSSMKHSGTIVRLLVFLPLALPPVVAGLALSAAIGRRGVAAPLLELAGIHFAFTYLGVIAAHVFIALPFIVVTVDAAFRQLDKEVMYSAASIGMSRSKILRHIVLPAIRPAISTGAGLVCARSLGEFGATITFAGSLPGVTRTMPVGIYLEREINPATADVLAAILMLLALGVLIISNAGSVITWLTRPRERPTVTGSIDVATLRALTRPDEQLRGELKVTTNRGTIIFRPNVSTAIIGPNGSGKSTLLELISGRLRGAEVFVGDTALSALPSHCRSVVALTQSPGLPPQATVTQAIMMVVNNRKRVTALLEAAGLTDLAPMRCRHLSGGQAAQVALLRALSVRPQVVLLDEPLAEVDVAQAAMWRAFFHMSSGDHTRLFVSHDPFDVSAMAHDLVVLDQGAPVARGSVDKVLTQPVNSFVSEFAGLNVLQGTVTASVDGITTLNVSGHSLVGLSDSTIAIGASAKAIFPPDAVTLALSTTDLSDTSARNHCDATVKSVTAYGAATTVVLDIGNGAVMSVPITTASARKLGIQPHSVVRYSIKTMSIRIVALAPG